MSFDFYRCDKLVKYWNMAEIRHLSHAHNALCKSQLNETWCKNITLRKSDAEIKAEPCLNCCLASPCLNVKYYPAQTAACHPGFFRCLCVFAAPGYPCQVVGLQRPWGGRLKEARTCLQIMTDNAARFTFRLWSHRAPCSCWLKHLRAVAFSC